MFEKLARLEDATSSAQISLGRWPFNAVLTTQVRALQGRCFARLGRLDEAEVVLRAAIDSAHHGRAHFLELTTRRDYIVAVVDRRGGGSPHDSRATELPFLGKVVAAMPRSQTLELTAVLGSGLDAAAALEAFRTNSD